jgi:hypothetical protein
MNNKLAHVMALAVFGCALGCGGNSTPSGSANDGGSQVMDGSDANVGGDAADAAAACHYYGGPDAGNLTCPADGKTVCPYGDGCNTCICFTNGSLQCTTHPC